MTHRIYLAAVSAFVLAVNAGAAPTDEQHSMPMSQEAMHSAAIRDTRELVHFPEPLREHELANMRDHLLTLSRIQEYLAQKEFDKAGELAEKRLGMSSFGLHGAHEVAPYMPKGMQDAGTAMHHAASRFAIATQEAAIDGDVARALGALNEVTQACVACHAAYRLQ
jgi:cytochrome c556